MDKQLLDDDVFMEKTATAMAEDFGTEADDKLDNNEKVDAFIEEFGDVNFYTCTTLLVLDPDQEFETWRANLKMVLLPCFQILVPFGMCWYFLVQKDLIASNGYCSNHGNVIFRFTGFVTFMYSGWQIMDGCDDASAKFFLTKSVRQWSRTGLSEDLRAAFMFYLGYLSQQLCCILLLMVTYVIYSSQCDTPLDLLMNCVAINFVLDIDSEWMSDAMQDDSKKSATWLFMQWRDTCTINGAEIKTRRNSLVSVRGRAEKLCSMICGAGVWLIGVSAYLLVFGWTFCPPHL